MKKVFMYFAAGLMLMNCLYSCNEKEEESAKSSEKEITAFSIGTQQGTIDATAKTITFTFPQGTDVTALTPVIVVSKNATVSPASGVVQNFINAVSYIVTAEDKTTQTYTVTVNVTVEQHTEAKIVTFSFAQLTPKVEAAIDENKKTVSAVLPQGTVLTALVPTIVVSDGATVSPASGVAQDFTKTVHYTVTTADKTTQVYTVNVAVGKNHEAKITAFSFDKLTPKVVATIDEGAKKISAEVSYGVPLTALVPTINVSDKAAVSPASDVAQDFTNPLEYTVTAEDGVTTSKYTVSISVESFATAITNVTPTTVNSGDSIIITGIFAVSGNKVELNTTELTIMLQNATTIIASIPIDISEGAYSLSVTSNGNKADYSDNIIVEAIEDPTKPRIISLNKEEIMKGIDNLVVTGLNLGTYTYIYFEKTNESYVYTSAYPQDGTTVTYTASGFLNSFFTVGEYKVWLTVNNVATNKLPFTIVENSNPVPTITAVSDWNPCRGDNVTVTGANFGEDAIVELDLDGFSIRPDVVSHTATTLIFSTENLYLSDRFVAVRVLTGGQVATKTGTFQAKQCLTEIIGITPQSGTIGEVITINGKYINNFLQIQIGDEITYGSQINSSTQKFMVPYGVPQGTTTIKITDYYDTSKIYYEGTFTVL
ncbi:MAG: DUF5018 domain-containing protein [Prevotellaceae bacterium]|jgi:hypothetical protein|nr:DUF5018 domain-containing protein [Prevotellaceae bacterium]